MENPTFENLDLQACEAIADQILWDCGEILVHHPNTQPRTDQIWCSNCDTNHQISQEEAETTRCTNCGVYMYDCVTSPP